MEPDAAIKLSTEPSETAAVMSSATSSVGTSSQNSGVSCVEPTAPKDSHKCVFCSQKFETKLALQEHFRRHANGEIDIKGMLKVKKSKADDKRKISKESQPRTARFESAKCDICSEVFSSISTAITHKFRKHPESVEKHYCLQCGMMFPIKANRDKHLQSHGSVICPNQVFPCLPCKVAFYNEQARSFHIESAHKGAIRLVNPIQTPAPSLKIVVNNAGEAHSIYYCHLCGCEYQVKYNLQKHLISRHTEEERNATPEAVVQCSMCSALFYSERAYAAHSLHHRHSDLYATSESMRQRVVQRIDQDFDLRRVPTPLEKIVSASAIWQNRSETWKAIRAAKKKEKERKEETPVNEYYESNLTTENNSKNVQNNLRIEEETNKHIDLKDANENIFSESSVSDGSKNNTISLNKVLKSNDFISDSSKKKVCLEKTKNFESKLIKTFDVDSGTDTGAEFNKSKSAENVEKLKDEPLENIRFLTENPKDLENLYTCADPLVMESPKEILDTTKDEVLETTTAQLLGKVHQTKPVTISPHKDKSEESDSEELEVEKIVGIRVGADGGHEYLVRWVGFEPADDTWEKEMFLNCPLLIQEFLSENKKRAVSPSDVDRAKHKKRKKTKI